MTEGRESATHSVMPASAFAPADLAGIAVRNRILRSATHEGLADERGLPTEALQRRYLALAQGGVGAIITGYAGVQQDGKSSLLRMLMIDGDDCIPAYRALVEAVHGAGTPIILQIAHCGRQTCSRVTGLPTVAPSAIRDRLYGEDEPRALSESAIEELIESFVAAIGRARQAGFDGVQLHGAHGYLLSEFLSSYMNRRTDRWGGSVENRFRIVGEILARARSRLGAYPILMKLNGYDGRPGGMRVPEAIAIARMAETAGCSALEVSCGVGEDLLFTARSDALPVDALMAYSHKLQTAPRFTRLVARAAMRVLIPLLAPPAKPKRLYNVDAAEQIRRQIGIPVIVVGGIRSRSEIEQILGQDRAQFVSLCRPLIFEPGLVGKMERGQQEASRCLDCCYCIVAGETLPLRCHYGRISSADPS